MQVFYCYTAIQINAPSLEALSPPTNIFEVKTHLFGHSQLVKELNFPQFFYRFRPYSRKQSANNVGWLSVGRWRDAVYIDILWWLYEYKIQDWIYVLYWYFVWDVCIGGWIERGLYCIFGESLDLLRSPEAQLSPPAQKDTLDKRWMLLQHHHHLCQQHGHLRYCRHQHH